MPGAAADYTSEEEEDGSDIEMNRAKRLEKAKEALRDSDEESEKSKRSSRLVLTLLGISWVTMTDAILREVRLGCSSDIGTRVYATLIVFGDFGALSLGFVSSWLFS